MMVKPNNLNDDWQTILLSTIEKPYFQDLLLLVDNAYKTATCFPPKDLIFEAFNRCLFEDLKVVIIGQDPYHGEGEANGLCFSVNDGVKIPPSLRNIFREINDDFQSVFMPNSGNLLRWAKQGVLLLNATLTVEKDRPNSHKSFNWTIFTDAVIEKISAEKAQVVFLLWGNFAQKKAILIDGKKHLILQTGHPSPMSANQGKWFGNKHFSSANAYLKSSNQKEIDW